MKKKIVVVVCLLCQRVDKKTGEYTVFGKLGKHTVTEKFFSDQHTDHDIIFAQSVNRMEGSRYQSEVPDLFSEGQVFRLCTEDRYRNKHN